MHEATVELKDGRTFCGIIWKWRPKEGYFTLGGLNENHYDYEIPDKFYFDEIEEAVEEGQRVRADEIRDVDLLKKAKDEGWEPEES